MMIFDEKGNLVVNQKDLKERIEKDMSKEQEKSPKAPEEIRKEELEKKIKDAVKDDPQLCDPRYTQYSKLLGC